MASGERVFDRVARVAQLLHLLLAVSLDKGAGKIATVGVDPVAGARPGLVGRLVVLASHEMAILSAVEEVREIQEVDRSR